MDKYKGADIGIVVECEGGYVTVPDYKTAIIHDKDGKVIRKLEAVSNHFENFIDAVRSRDESRLNAPIRGGHLSTALCHTGNISYRVGHHQAPDSIREQIQADKDDLATYQRMAEHLAANDVDIEKTPLTLGKPLRMNPANSRFMANKEANFLLARQPREPFAIKLT
jgi:hypothetical protein